MLTSRILIVDDDEAQLQQLTEVLTRAGYENLVGTTDPGQVPELMTQEADLILLNLHLPGAEGPETLEWIKEHVPPDPFLPVIVLVTDGSAEAKARCLELGTADFLSVPLDETEVIVRVRNFLEMRRMHRQLTDANLTLEQRIQERTAELAESNAMLRKSDVKRRHLTAYLVDAQEDERRRIAADVHDDSVQAIAVVAMRLEMLHEHLEDSDVRARVGKLLDDTRQALARLRQLLFDLRPLTLDTDGLGAALKDLLGYSDDGTTWTVEDTFEEQPEGWARTVLYRIAQEAIRNARKHGHPERLQITLADADGGFQLEVADNGSGFALNGETSGVGGHLGIESMKERAELAGGWCEIDSELGVGTTVRAWLPRGLVPPSGQDVAAFSPADA